MNKRLKRRVKQLGREGLTAYRSYLEENPEEWRRLDEFCRIPISRFYRDRGVFQLLQDRVLPELAERASDEGRSVIRVWSAGCASGEEVYTLRIPWDLTLAPRFPDCRLAIIGTDVDTLMLSRAGIACYKATSLRELPQALILDAFEHKEGTLRSAWIEISLASGYRNVGPSKPNKISGAPGECGR